MGDNTINAFLMGHPELRPEDRKKVYEIQEKLREAEVKKKPSVIPVEAVYKSTNEPHAGYAFGDRESNPNATPAAILQLTGQKPVWV